MLNEEILNDASIAYAVRQKEGEYKGKKVTLNKPFRTPDGPKKFAVYVENDKGNVIVVRFGDTELSVKSHDPERRKSFRARHKCDQVEKKADLTSAGFWSCYYSWPKSGKVDGK